MGHAAGNGATGLKYFAVRWSAPFAAAPGPRPGPASALNQPARPLSALRSVSSGRTGDNFLIAIYKSRTCASGGGGGATLARPASPPVGPVVAGRPVAGPVAGPAP